MCRSSNIVRVIRSRILRWVGHIARMEEGRSAYRILIAKPRGKRSLKRSRLRWKDNIRRNRYQYEELGCFSSG